MAFDTRADLANAIGAWLNRDDLTLRISEFIRLVEADLNLELRDPDQITTATLTFTGGAASVPADFGQMIAFGASGDRLELLTPGEFGTISPQSGTPRVYALIGGKINVLPSASGAIPVTYYRTIPPLATDASTNWLLARLPNLYLYGCLLQAEFFGWNDERLPLINAKYSELIGRLRVDGENRRWGSAPLAPRIKRA